VCVLRQADTDVTIAEVCGKRVVTRRFLTMGEEYGCLDVPELRRLKQLEEGNQHL
jgi:hypothetical protein